MTEWPIVHPWKGCVGETPPRVRIPLSPPLTQSMQGESTRDERFRRSAAEMANAMSNPLSIKKWNNTTPANSYFIIYL